MDPQQLQMLMALQGQQQQGMGTAGMGSGLAAMAQQPVAPSPMPQAPLMNGQNASLGASGGASLGTPADMYQALMTPPPMMNPAQAYGNM